MYRQHFGLTESPFSLTPDTQFYFNNTSHREVLSAILLALRHSEGFIKVVGEVGTGKTLLCRKLLDHLDGRYQTAYIPNPYLSPDELKWFLAEEIGVSTKDKPAYKLLNDINQRLIQLAASKRQVVLIVDEAQAMPRETLEALRLLTNLETAKRKLLQVVLLGQPELDEMLDRPDLRQLKQRIVFSEYLQAIDSSNVARYVDARLMAAGYSGEPLFSSQALSLLMHASGGIPRLINVLCHKALMAAYGEGAYQVSRKHMARAVKDTPESRRRGQRQAQQLVLWMLTGALAALVLIGVPLWFWGRA
ncbi:MAG TPA: AAA family ATPase [Cellvibrionaceae bacterium]